jgi:hypothetical protein
MHSGSGSATSKLLSEDELCAYEDRIADLIGAVGIDERCEDGKQQRLFGVSVYAFNLQNR